MKTYRSAVKWIGLSVAVGLMMGWVALAQERPRLQNNVIILPGTAISKDDEKAMNAILKQYDKSLYRIDTYEKGKRTKTEGSLNNVVIGRKLMSEVAENAKKTGFTQYALRIGFEIGSGHNQAASPTPEQKSSKTDSADLVRKLKPILEKYNKQ
jgi:hypothetical protein